MTAALRGQVYALLGLSRSTALLGPLRLPLSDPAALRALVRQVARHCPQPVYCAMDDLWVVHFDTLSALVESNAARALPADDTGALARWCALAGLAGKEAGHRPPAPRLWFSALMQEMDWEDAGFAPEIAGPVGELQAALRAAAEAPALDVACEALRAARMTAEDLALATRFNLVLEDDVMDPLAVLYQARQGPLLADVLAEVLGFAGPLPRPALRHLAEVWCGGPEGRAFCANWPEADLRALVGDIRAALVAEGTHDR